MRMQEEVWEERKHAQQNYTSDTKTWSYLMFAFWNCWVLMIFLFSQSPQSLFPMFKEKPVLFFRTPGNWQMCLYKREKASLGIILLVAELIYWSNISFFQRIYLYFFTADPVCPQIATKIGQFGCWGKLNLGPQLKVVKIGKLTLLDPKIASLTIKFGFPFVTKKWHSYRSW